MRSHNYFFNSPNIPDISIIRVKNEPIHTIGRLYEKLKTQKRYYTIDTTNLSNIYLPSNTTTTINFVNPTDIDDHIKSYMINSLSFEYVVNGETNAFISRHINMSECTFIRTNIDTCSIEHENKPIKDNISVNVICKNNDILRLTENIRLQQNINIQQCKITNYDSNNKYVIFTKEENTLMINLVTLIVNNKSNNFIPVPGHSIILEKLINEFILKTNTGYDCVININSKYYDI